MYARPNAETWAHCEVSSKFLANPGVNTSSLHTLFCRYRKRIAGLAERLNLRLTVPSEMSMSGAPFAFRSDFMHGCQIAICPGKSEQMVADAIFAAEFGHIAICTAKSRSPSSFRDRPIPRTPRDQPGQIAMCPGFGIRP